MASTDARPIPKKNVAYRVTFPIFDADGDLVTGATALDSEVSIDGGTFADCASEATEIATTSGMYFLDLTNTEMNGDTIAIIVKTSSVGAKTTPIVLYPEEAGDIRVDVTMISGDAAAADNAESFFDGNGYAGTNNVIPTVTTTGTATNVTTVNGLAANVITATAIANDAITAAKIADGAIDAATFAANAINDAAVASDVTIASVTGAVGSVTGAVGSVTGAVGSVTGNVGGNVVGSVASVTAGVTVTTNNDKTGYGLSAAAIQAIWDALTSALTTVGSIGKRIVDNLDATISSRLASASYTTPPTAAANADAVWEEAIADHSGTAGSTAEALNAAGSAGDPWSTALPGAYGSGSAGNIIGNNLNATVSSRATPAQVNTEADTALADYDPPTFAELDARTDAIDSALAIIAGYLDTEVAATLAAVDTEVAATLAAIAALNNLSAAQVNAELLDVLTVDTFAEASAVPAATSTLKDKINWLFVLARNKIIQSSTQQRLRNDADAGNIATATVSDDGTDATRNEWV